MLETIKDQFSKAKTLSKSLYYRHNIKQNNKIANELYPFALDYFHELNPAFLFKITHIQFLKQYSAITVRDGEISFGDFILRNFQAIPEMKTIFIIHPSLAPIVPDSLKKCFATWNIVHTKLTSINNAKRILILGINNEHVLPSLEEIKQELRKLKNISPHIEIDLFLPTRSHPFALPWSESYVGYKVIEAIKDILPKNKLNFLNHAELMEKSSFHSTYCLDLMTNKMVITDSYMNHHLSSRGAAISSFGLEENKKSFFEIDLSLSHKIQFSSMPEVDTIFPEMIFYKKQTSTTDYASDPLFHSLFRKKNF